MSDRPTVAEEMRDAALAFVASLDDEQRRTGVHAFDDMAERTRWFYTPTDHGGLPMSSMRPAQQRLALRLVAAGLSAAGYGTVATIMGLDNVLDRTEGWSATWGRERGRDPGLYYLRVFGDPSGRDPWSWRFGGHHVSVHHVLADGEVRASTPTFFGADPASSPLLGPHLLRPLAALEDLGRELVQSLDAQQRARALLAPVAPVDHVGANRARLAEGDLPLPLADVWRTRFTGELGERVVRIQEAAEQSAGLTAEHLAAVRLTAAPRGIVASALAPSQRAVLRSLLDAYVGRLPDELADAERDRLTGAAVFDRLHFAWAGSLEPGQGHYYRVQGGDLLVEYDNTQRGANHVHTIWRDLRADFGGEALRGYPADPLREHLAADHQ